MGENANDYQVISKKEQLSAVCIPAVGRERVEGEGEGERTRVIVCETDRETYRQTVRDRSKEREAQRERDCV